MNGREEEKKEEKGKRGKRGRNYRKGKERKDNGGRRNGSTSNCSERYGNNDPRWYSNDPVLIENSARISFYNPLGAKVEDICDGPVSVPGVMCLKTAPTVGWSDGPTSPINVAARAVYGYVVHANSRNRSYNDPDLMIYLLAMGNMYAYHAWLCRVYGLLNTYSRTNRYYPDAVLLSEGINFTDLRSKMPELLYYINSYAARIGQMNVPDAITYVSRQIWMYSNIWTDSAEIKSQTYLYSPAGFYKYEPVASSTGGKLKYMKLFDRDTYSAAAISLSKIKSYGDALIDAIVTDEDMNIMSGDILKAYGPEKLFKVPQIPVEYSVLPQFSLEVVQQFQNATILPGAVCAAPNTGVESWSKFDITQKDNYLVANPTMLLDSTMYKKGVAVDFEGLTRPRIINSPVSVPNAAQNMVSTRLTAITERKPEAYDGVGAVSLEAIKIKHCATEVVVFCNIVAMRDTANGWKPVLIGQGWDEKYGNDAKYTLFHWLSTCPSVGESSGNAAADKVQRKSELELFSMMDAFAFHPILIPSQFTDTVDSHGAAIRKISNRSLYGQFENYTVLDADALDKMHDTALLSEFTVPQYGRVSGQ